MMKVTIELISAQTGKTTHLGTVAIANTGERTALNPKEADYNVTYFNRAGKVFKRSTIQRWRRLDKSIWKLMVEVFDVFDTSA